MDGVQAWGKVPQRLNGTAIDSYAVSGHKIHAPKGVGALYVRRGYNLAPVFLGGGQEQSVVRAPKTWPISPPWPGLLNGCWRTEAAPGASRR
ncbi:MAG: aminotransferase class V-fold PLP-dependent enzyme [Ruthenibacterium lactatiformans]